MGDEAQAISSETQRAAQTGVRDLHSTEVELHEQEQEHPGGGRFNRLLLVVVVARAMIVGVVAAQGIRSAGVSSQSVSSRAPDDGMDASRNKAEVEELAASGARRETPATTLAPLPAIRLPNIQSHVEQRRARPPSRFAQWAEDKYMKALEAPQMVAAFHSGPTLEIASAKQDKGANAVSAESSSDPNVALRPPASPYSVMAGSVIPAVMVSGINSDLPGPILAQVSENVFDSAKGQVTAHSTREPPHRRLS